MWQVEAPTLRVIAHTAAAKRGSTFGAVLVGGSRWVCHAAILRSRFKNFTHATDILTLSKEVGNSASMIEQHCSKLTATLVVDRLA